MDIVYIIGKNCSKCNNNELRYSLRSIEKYGKNVGKVYVAGYCPEWLSDEVIKVPFEQPYSHPDIIEKHINRLSTTLFVVDNTDISDEFLISMDDHFYIKETDFNNYPYYAKIVKGSTDLGAKNSLSRYGRFILNTGKFLKSLNLPTYYFCLHRNMHLSKKIINECRDTLNRIIKNKIECEELAFILNYWVNKEHFNITPVKDIKIKLVKDWNKVNPDNTEVFSTSDFESGSKLDILIQNLFPDKCKYEK